MEKETYQVSTSAPLSPSPAYVWPIRRHFLLPKLHLIQDKLQLLRVNRPALVHLSKLSHQHRATSNPHEGKAHRRKHPVHPICFPNAFSWVWRSGRIADKYNKADEIFKDVFEIIVEQQNGLDPLNFRDV